MGGKFIQIVAGHWSDKEGNIQASIYALDEDGFVYKHEKGIDGWGELSRDRISKEAAEQERKSKKRNFFKKDDNKPF